jgi:hypothetical protein
MSDTDVVTTEPSVALQRVSDAALDRAARMGLWLAAVEAKENSPKARGMANALKIAYTESMGLPAHMASEFHIINGNFATSAQIRRAQAFMCGFQILPTQETDDSCTVQVIDRASGRQVGKDVTFTLADAARMGLSGKDNWKKNPAAMLFARATTKAIGIYIPHVRAYVFSNDTFASSMDAVYTAADAEVVIEADDVPFGDPE